VGFDKDFTAHALILVKVVAKSAQHTDKTQLDPAFADKITSFLNRV
jgi:hypothetical protein